MRLIPLLLLFLFPFVSTAQIVDDSALDDLANGDLRFEEGAFVAYLADTVSPAYVSRIFQEENLQIDEVHISRLSILVVNWPSDSTMNKLEEEPLITAVVPIRTGDLRMMLTDSLQRAGVDQVEIAEAAANYLKGVPVGTYLLEFDYSVDAIRAANILTQYSDLAFKFTPWVPRTVTVITEPGKEQEVMERVEQLPYVQYTALIGIAGDR